MWSVEVSFNLPAGVRLKTSRAFDRLLKRDDLGFLKDERIDSSLVECEKNLHFFDEKEYLVVVGLGGSSLGTKALYQGLFDKWEDKIFFLDNVDAVTVDFFLEKPLPWKKVAWVVVSKSGKTMETLSLYNYCHLVLCRKKFYSIIENTAVITELKESPLYEFAVKENLPLLSVPFDIGGRFSVFTPVGFFPLAFMGRGLRPLVKGYKKALAGREQVIEVAGQLWASRLRKEMNLYSFQYCESLGNWSLWLQQLWSESLSKEKNHKGSPAPANSTFVPCRGVSDQHSVLQQIIEGVEKKFVLFHQVQASEVSAFRISGGPVKNSLMEQKGLGQLLNAEMLATRKAIQQSGCQTMTLTTQELTAESLSQLMGLWMLVVGTLGELFRIDAFNQPGVESGKTETCRILSRLC